MVRVGVGYTAAAGPRRRNWVVAFLLALRVGWSAFCDELSAHCGGGDVGGEGEVRLSSNLLHPSEQQEPKGPLERAISLIQALLDRRLKNDCMSQLQEALGLLHTHQRSEAKVDPLRELERHVGEAELDAETEDWLMSYTMPTSLGPGVDGTGSRSFRRSARSFSDARSSRRSATERVASNNIVLSAAGPATAPPRQLRRASTVSSLDALRESKSEMSSRLSTPDVEANYPAQKATLRAAAYGPESPKERRKSVISILAEADLTRMKQSDAPTAATPGSAAGGEGVPGQRSPPPLGAAAASITSLLTGAPAPAASNGGEPPRPQQQTPPPPSPLPPPPLPPSSQSPNYALAGNEEWREARRALREQPLDWTYDVTLLDEASCQHCLTSLFLELLDRHHLISHLEDEGQLALIVD